MDAYVYRADLYCAECAVDLPCCVECSSSIAGEGSRLCYQRPGCDSECCPQGPYAAGGGEADSPQHCGRCGKFLENPLTADGLDYVRQLIAGDMEEKALSENWTSTALQEWAPFYGINPESPWGENAND